MAPAYDAADDDERIGEDPFEEPAAKRIVMLVSVNVGLLLFALGGLTYLTHGWDPTAFYCTAGYVMCGIGLALPSCFGKVEERKLAEFAPTCSGLYRFVGSVLNILGLCMGIAGSLMYSPTINRVMYRLDEEREFEFMRQFANVIWAVSFFLFPVGVGLFFLDRKMTLTAYNATRGKPPPSVFDKNLRVLMWSFVMLCVCAVGGIFFCFDDEPGAEIAACALFGLAGAIKVSLLCVEVAEMCGYEVSACCGGRGGEGRGGGRGGAGGKGAGGGETAPLLGGGARAIPPDETTAGMLGDPFSPA